MPSFIDGLMADLGPLQRPLPKRQPLPGQGGFVETLPQPEGSMPVNPQSPLANWKPGAEPSFLARPSAKTRQISDISSMPTGGLDAAMDAGFTDLGGGDVKVPNAGAYSPDELAAVKRGAGANLAGMKPLLGRNETTGESFVMQPSVRVRPDMAQSFIGADQRGVAQADALREKTHALSQRDEQESRAREMAGLDMAGRRLDLTSKQHAYDQSLLDDPVRQQINALKVKGAGREDSVADAQSKLALRNLEREMASSPANSFADSFLKNANLSDPRQAAFAGKVAPYSKSLQGLPPELQQGFVGTMGPQPGQAALQHSDEAGKILAHPLVAQPIQEVIHQLETVGVTPENGPMLQLKISRAIQKAVEFGAKPADIKAQIHALLASKFPDAHTEPSAINQFLRKASYVAPVQGSLINYFAGRGEDQRQALASFLDAN